MPTSPHNVAGSYMGSFLSQQSLSSLKRTRAASAPCETEEARQRKRSKGSIANTFITEKMVEDVEGEERPESDGQNYKGKGKEKALLPTTSHAVLGPVTSVVIEELAQELKCGCCTELCYHPVIVNPCQHFFCGSCCVLWVRNGGTNCPACRGISTSVTPSRVLQSMIDLLLRADASKARTANERAQADQVYRVGTPIRLPTPRPPSPEPNLEPPNDNFARPCPTCLAGNAYGWRCPVPIQDPAVDPENAFDLDDGTPIGHAFCGNCDQLHNLQAPTTTKCDFCQVSFCGVGIQGRCCALGLLSQQPHAMNDLPDLILSGAIYECFQDNSVEVDILVDYLRANDITLRGVYKEIIAYTLQQPNTFIPLIDRGIFDDLHGVAGGDDPDPTAPRRRICRLCAAQVLIHGFKDWWIRERKHGHLPDDVFARKDCPGGSTCNRQNDPAHCKEFNHIIAPPLPPQSSNQQSMPATPNANANAFSAMHNAASLHQLGIFYASDIDLAFPLPSPPTPPPTENPPLPSLVFPSSSSSGGNEPNNVSNNGPNDLQNHRSPDSSSVSDLNISRMDMARPMSNLNTHPRHLNVFPTNMNTPGTSAIPLDVVISDDEDDDETPPPAMQPVYSDVEMNAAASGSLAPKMAQPVSPMAGM